MDQKHTDKKKTVKCQTQKWAEPNNVLILVKNKWEYGFHRKLVKTKNRVTKKTVSSFLWKTTHCSKDEMCVQYFTDRTWIETVHVEQTGSHCYLLWYNIFKEGDLDLHNCFACVARATSITAFTSHLYQCSVITSLGGAPAKNKAGPVPSSCWFPYSLLVKGVCLAVVWPRCTGEGVIFTRFTVSWPSPV